MNGNDGGCIDRRHALCYPVAAHRLLHPPGNLKAAEHTIHVAHDAGHCNATDLLPVRCCVSGRGDCLLDVPRLALRSVGKIQASQTPSLGTGTQGSGTKN